MIDIKHYNKDNFRIYVYNKTFNLVLLRIL